MLVALVALVTTPAMATVMVEVPLDQMVRESVGIVHARVIHSGVQLVMSEDSLDPHTVTTLEVQDWIRGEGPQRITLRELGGVHAQGGMWIDGTPTYDVGEEVVVFLKRDPESSQHYRTLHMVQGKFVVMHGVPGVPTTVRRDTRAVAFADWTRWGMTLRHGGQEAMALDEFLRALEGTPRTRDERETTGGGR